MADGVRQITKEEWDAYEWVEASTYGDYAEGRAVFIRGCKRQVNPPEDGLAYIKSRYEDRWLPAMTAGDA